jgi:hypothetical protein
MVRRSAPASSRCVAKQCLKVCGCTGLVIPARSGSFPASAPDHVRRDRVAGSVPAISGKQPDPGWPPQAAPVCAEFLQQFGAEHDVAVFASFAALNVDDHPLAVDIADLQVGQFGAAESGCVSGHQQHAVKRCVRPVDQLRDFLAEDHRQAHSLLWVRSVGHAEYNADIHPHRRGFCPLFPPPT